MKKFYIIVSELDQGSKRKVYGTEEKLTASLLKYDGVSVDRHRGFLSRDFRVPEDIECVITIGGDGTMLRASRAAYGNAVKFIGINRGHMGYLTEITDISDRNGKDYDEIAGRLVNDDFTVEDKMMLSARVWRDGKCVYRDFALNDVLFGKNDSIRMISFDVYIRDTLLNSYKADGFVVASPTGSTGYNMSAGGPIADPSDRLLILTPICPHSINTRAMVLSSESKVKLVARSEAQLVSCDGSDGFPLLNGDELVVTRSRLTMKFIKFKETSFLDTLRERMRPV